jgi:hypothetical protein
MVNSEDLRARYRPRDVDVLFIGESPPAGGTFFYAANSNLYYATEEAFRRGVPEILSGDFLDDFQLGDLGRDRRQALEHRADALARLIVVLGVEDLAQRGRHQRALAGSAMLVHVANEVNRAALPRAAEHPGDRAPESLVGV